MADLQHTILQRASIALAAGVNDIFSQTSTSHAIMYDKLVKDAPTYLGYPAVDIGGGQASLSIEICSGTTFICDPLQRILDEASVIPSHVDVTLCAEFEDGSLWPLDLGFQRLVEYIAFCGTHAIPFKKWIGLEITLPRTELPFDPSRTSPLPVELLENLRYMEWTGHRKQLVASWLPFNTSFIKSLTTINLTCELSLVDCSYVIFYARHLKDFTLRTIKKDLAHDQVFTFPPPTDGVERPWLESLALKSDEDIAPLLEPFIFPSLRAVALSLNYYPVSSLHGLTFWKTLETVTLGELLPYRDMQKIREHCGPMTQFYRTDPDFKEQAWPSVAGYDDEG